MVLRKLILSIYNEFHFWATKILEDWVYIILFSWWWQYCGVPRWSLAHPYLIGRTLLFVKSIKSRICQHPVFTSKMSFHDIEGVVPAEEFVSRKFIFAVWGIRWRFLFPGDESLYDMSRNKVSKRCHRVLVKGYFVELRSRIAQSYSTGRLWHDCSEERREPVGELGGIYSLY